MLLHWQSLVLLHLHPLTAADSRPGWQGVLQLHWLAWRAVKVLASPLSEEFQPHGDILVRARNYPTPGCLDPCNCARENGARDERHPGDQDTSSTDYH